ncbi:MAG: ATP-binding cassette domain-containing protein [Acidimicrobiia bacterium]
MTSIAEPSQSASAHGIVVDGLVKEFKEGVRAVDGIHFHVEPGEIYGFLGPNGAGKSTTVLMLTTLLPPTAGTGTVAGHDIVRDPAGVRSVMGVALQEVALDPMLTGLEHLQLQASLQGLPKARTARRCVELLERVGLTDAASRKTATYSGGMKRRLDLALALVHSPSILFLDEPTTGIDPANRVGLWDEVAKLAREDGVTVLLTTQYLEEADQLAQRIGIIDGGRIVAEGTPASLKAEIGRPRIEVRPEAAADVARVETLLRQFGADVAAPPGKVGIRFASAETALANVVRELDQAHIAIAELQVFSPTLDDVFMAKTGHSLEGDEGQ